MVMQKGGRITPYGAGGGKGASGEPDEGRMILVSNLPVTAEWQEVKDHMGQAGKVEFVNVLPDEMGNSSCSAFVRFATAAQAEAAISMLNGTSMAGRHGTGGEMIIGVDYWTGPKPATTKGPLRSFSGEPDEGRMIHVSNLPFTAEWQEVKDHMGQAGVVEFVSVLADEMGNKKGSAFVRFASAMEADMAVSSLNGTTMSGKDGAGGQRIIKVGYWTGPKPVTAKGQQMGTVAGSMQGGSAKGMFMTWQQMEMMQMNMMNQMLMGGPMPGLNNMKGMFSKGGGKKGGKNEPDKKVRVTGLPDGVQWQELKDHMNNAGPVEFCNVANAVGEVRYGSSFLAKKAISLLNGSMMDLGGPITVEPWV